MAFALSSPETQFHSECSHSHGLVCDRCETLNNVIMEIELFVDSKIAELRSTDDYERLEEIQHDLASSIPLIEDWKAHTLRAAHQDSAKTSLLDSLAGNQVLLIMDWAMKFLPSSFRESQKEWFGKKGRSWHVSVAIQRGEDDLLETRTFIHVFEQCTQNWFAVLSMIEHTLATVKKDNSHIDEVFLRSDNAGCYHCGFIILSLPGVSQRTGVAIKRYDFSDPQAGKDVCDRRIAVLKSHIRRFVNEGHDVQTAVQMKAALESYGGVKGCYVAIATVNESCQTMLKHSMVGVQGYNNFFYEPSGLRVWKAYNLGPGKLFLNSQLEKMGTAQGATQLEIVDGFATPEQATGLLLRRNAPATDPKGRPEVEDDDNSCEQREDTFFSCPVDGCIKKYLGHATLQTHLDVGKHLLKLARESSYDTIKRKWAEACQEVSSTRHIAVALNEEEQPGSSSEPSAIKGWAIKKGKKATRFTDKVKAYLLGVFLEGEETGKKANPAEVSAILKSLHSPTGGKHFKKEEWLTTQQVVSYFSRLASLNRSGRLRQGAHSEPNEDEREDQECEQHERATEKLRQEIRRQIEL